MADLGGQDLTGPRAVDYDRGRVTPGILHFGVGGFHRAHQAVYLDDLLRQGRAFDWGIIGVGTLPGDRAMRDALERQDHLYTLVIKHDDGRLEPRTIGSIIGYHFAPDDPESVLARLTDPAIRIVSLTITEGGYHIHPVTGELDPSDPLLRHDLAGEAPIRSVFGFLVEGLRRRRAMGLAPFTVLSCDNLPGNGTIARRMLCAFAARIDPELATWIEASVRFPNCMVDRITPATTDDDIAALQREFGIVDAWPVVCEPYTQWVLEDEFATVGEGRPPWQHVGVQLVDDVVPYELMKLRLLNASHQAMAYLGLLEGYRFAHEVSADPLYRRFLRNYMDREARPTLPPVPGVDLDDYCSTLLDRFASPAVSDPLSRLAAEASDRIPKFLLPVVEHNLHSGGPIALAALVVASWARYAEGTDEHGTSITVVDRLRDELQAAAARHDEDLLAFVRNRDLFGDLATDPRFSRAYTEALTGLRTHGARATLTRVVEEN